MLATKADYERTSIDDALAAYERMMFEGTKFTRVDLKQFLKQKFNLTLTEIQACEGLHICRGK